jgi:hypothetical protein
VASVRPSVCPSAILISWSYSFSAPNTSFGSLLVGDKGGVVGVVVVVLLGQDMPGGMDCDVWFLARKSAATEVFLLCEFFCALPKWSFLHSCSHRSHI